MWGNHSFLESDSTNIAEVYTKYLILNIEIVSNEATTFVPNLPIYE